MLWLKARSSEALGATIAIVKAPPSSLESSDDPQADATKTKDPSRAKRLVNSLIFFLIFFLSLTGLPDLIEL
jgi:hypothetical protein